MNPVGKLKIGLVFFLLSCWMFGCYGDPPKPKRAYFSVRNDTQDTMVMSYVLHPYLAPAAPPYLKEARDTVLQGHLCKFGSLVVSDGTYDASYFFRPESSQIMDSIHVLFVGHKKCKIHLPVFGRGGVWDTTKNLFRVSRDYESRGKPLDQKEFLYTFTEQDIRQAKDCK